MDQPRASQTLIVFSMVAAFTLGAIFGALASRWPGRGMFSPRVALAPGLPETQDGLAAPPGAKDADTVPGDGSTTAPDGYPIKGNERSGIFHIPGGLAYDRTVATIHFRTPEAAEAAGYRQSKA
jgi:hypothetical protein